MRTAELLSSTQMRRTASSADKRRRATLPLVALLAAGALRLGAACSSPYGGTADETPPDGAVTPGADGSVTPSDGSVTPSDGGSGDVVAGPTNLLTNGGFESGCSIAWKSNDPFATVTDDPVAHGGAHACRICSSAFDGGTGVSVYFFSIYSQSVDVQPTAMGRSYDAEVWLRNIAGEAPFDVAAVALDDTLADGGAGVSTLGTATTPGTDWTRAGVSQTVAAGVSKVAVSVRLRRFNDKTACVLLDDASLVAR